MVRKRNCCILVLVCYISLTVYLVHIGSRIIVRQMKIIKHHTINCKNIKQYNGSLITFSGLQRLGNKMFRYASVYGIAKRNGKTVFLPSTHEELLTTFQLDYNCILSDEQKNTTVWSQLQEVKYAEFDKTLTRLASYNNIHIRGFLQSWKYFIAYSDDIRRQFRFRDHIQSKATAFLRRVTHTACSNLTTIFSNFCSISSNSLQPPVYVGVHVRRGDFKLTRFLELGFVPADERYVQSAMGYYCVQFVNVIFVVCGEEIKWNMQHIKLPPSCTGQKIIYCSQTSTPAVHMALLASCNHSIITAGSFGWWSAFLSGGKVVYDKNFPRKNSPLSKEYTAADYYLPNWIGM